MKVLITGSNGQLGYDVCKVFNKCGVEYLGVDIDDFDITDADTVSEFISCYLPDVVIHCSAYTAVDSAEEKPKLCHNVNVDGTRNIAMACKKNDSKLVYISTDYVFADTGDIPHEVDDETNPASIYGKTKLAGELVIKELLERHFIVRTSWVFGKNGNNFVQTMLRLGKESDEVSVVHDQIGSPTYTADLAPLLYDMILTEKYGTYHATNDGYCSWAEFAEEIFKQAGYHHTKVKRITTEEYSAKAIRPRNSRLSTDSLLLGGFYRLRPYTEALYDFLHNSR